jgi:hypothetical protein
MDEQIMVPCEGTGCPVHFPTWSVLELGEGICAMCGRLVESDRNEDARPHMRPDVIAMLKRGDYDRA